jgi:hypothetical protein
MCLTLPRSNPQNGVIAFDTFPWALLNVYVVVSVSNWIYIQMPLWSTTSAWCMVYFVTLIVFGSYFALSLVLVGAAAMVVGMWVLAHTCTSLCCCWEGMMGGDGLSHC